jgi:hypothetical protein
MTYPAFANKRLDKKLSLGSHNPNNSFLKWLSKQKTQYTLTYVSLGENLIVLAKDIGWLHFSNELKIGTGIYLNLLYIIPEERGKGHAKNLIGLIKCFTDDTKMPSVIIPTSIQGSSLERLRSFYKKLGYIIWKGFYIYEPERKL